MNHIMILYDAIIKRDVKDIVNRSQQGINLELELLGLALPAFMPDTKTFLWIV